MRLYGIESKIEKKVTPCYDFFDGHNTNGGKVNQNRIENMLHFYNVMTIDGKQVKIDIAGALTAIDCMKNNPNLPKINTSAFYFSDKLEANPFEQISLASINEAQPQ